jgi:two-component system, response regulator PdtaR
MFGATSGQKPNQETIIRSTVLVVEDEVLLRMVIADGLREAGYKVIEAANAEQALEALGYSFDVKLILTDVQMPGSLDGVGLARIVRSAFPTIKIVLTSGRFGEVNGAEHDAFFAKPFDPIEVVEHIATLID